MKKKLSLIMNILFFPLIVIGVYLLLRVADHKNGIYILVMVYIIVIVALFLYVEKLVNKDKPFYIKFIDPVAFKKGDIIKSDGKHLMKVVRVYRDTKWRRFWRMRINEVKIKKHKL